MEEAHIDIKQIKPDPTIKCPKYEVATEGYDPDDKEITGRKNSTMNYFTETIENSWLKFANWIKKSIAMMIIFILLGVSGGLYIAKIIYDVRMSEVCKVGGFVHDKKVYDVKLRP